MDIKVARHSMDDADAVLLPHTFGVPADGHRWCRLSNEYDVTLIEDCARALGTAIGGRPVGGFGEFAIYSLKKVSPAVEGGALAGTVDPSQIDLAPATYDIKNVYPLIPDRYKDDIVQIYQRVRDGIEQIYGKPSQPESSKFETSTPTHVRPRELDWINASIFCYYLLSGYRDQVADNVAAAKRIRSALEPLGFEFQSTQGRCPFHFIAMTVPSRRDELVARLRDAGIRACRFWNPPLVSTNIGERRLSEFPHTKTLVENGLQLPLVEMSDGDVRTSVEILQEATSRSNDGDSHGFDSPLLSTSQLFGTTTDDSV